MSDDLIKRVEALLESDSSEWMSDVYAGFPTIEALIRDLKDALLRERRDGERYRWLRKSRSLEVNAPDANEDGGSDVYYTLHEAALDARIDEELELNKSIAEDNAQQGSKT